MLFLCNVGSIHGPLTVLRHIVCSVLSFYIKQSKAGLSYASKIYFYIYAYISTFYSQAKSSVPPPQDYINEFIIRKVNPLVVVDFRFISAYSHARQLRNLYQLGFPEFDENVFYEI